MTGSNDIGRHYGRDDLPAATVSALARPGKAPDTRWSGHRRGPDARPRIVMRPTTGMKRHNLIASVTEGRVSPLEVIVEKPLRATS